MLVLVALSGCSPVLLRKCSVRPTRQGGVVFSADALNLTSSDLKQVDVHVDAVNYPIGPLRRGRWTHLESRISAQQIRADLFPLSFYLKPVDSCFAQAIVYPDGSMTILYNPI